MNILVQYPSQIRAEAVHPCDHGHLWIEDELDPGIIGSNLVADIRNKFGGAHVLLSSSPLPLDVSEAYCQNIKQECEDAIALQAEMPIESPQTCFKEDAAASSLEKMLSDNKPVRGSGETEYTKSNEYGSMKSISPTSTSFVLLPAAVEIVSAMKGSRQIQGLHIKKLSVTWAPDVYDPPVTSRCHSVKKCHQQHSRLHKKSHRHKHKAKTSRSGSSNGKKQQRQIEERLGV